jgi:hypothetical protein
VGSEPPAVPVLHFFHPSGARSSTRTIVCALEDGHLDTFDLCLLAFSDMTQELLEASKAKERNKPKAIHFSDAKN